MCSKFGVPGFPGTKLEMSEMIDDVEMVETPKETCSYPKGKFL